MERDKLISFSQLVKVVSFLYSHQEERSFFMPPPLAGKFTEKTCKSYYLLMDGSNVISILLAQGRTHNYVHTQSPHQRVMSHDQLAQYYTMIVRLAEHIMIVHGLAALVPVRDYIMMTSSLKTTRHAVSRSLNFIDTHQRGRERQNTQYNYSHVHACHMHVPGCGCRIIIFTNTPLYRGHDLYTSTINTTINSIITVL